MSAPVIEVRDTKLDTCLVFKHYMGAVVVTVKYRVSFRFQENIKFESNRNVAMAGYVAKNV